MPHIAIIGAGPAGLFAAERLAGLSHAVTLYDQMPSPGRKFLLAGRGGLNLTHSEPVERFIARYGAGASWIAPMIQAFPPEALRAWCEGLGQPVFVGSSGRVFPTSFKAAPLLRAWLRRLDARGVRFAPRHRWAGWAPDGALLFAAPAGAVEVRADATLLALGGASWPRMGADGGWVGLLAACGVRVSPLQASNCGVRIGWSAPFLARHEGAPLKRVALSVGDVSVRGEAVVTRSGLEGGAVYALSAALRAALAADGAALMRVDVRPDMAPADMAAKLDGPRHGRSVSNFLRHDAGLAPVAIGLVQEALHAGADGAKLSALVKSVPLTVTGLQPLERAISTAGGVAREELTEGLMIARLPGVFAAGEMLDWDAPTGGYLLQGCFSTAAAAAAGIEEYLKEGLLF